MRDVMASERHSSVSSRAAAIAAAAISNVPSPKSRMAASPRVEAAPFNGRMRAQLLAESVFLDLIVSVPALRAGSPNKMSSGRTWQSAISHRRAARQSHHTSYTV
jgi:hypothetical protein